MIINIIIMKIINIIIIITSSSQYLGEALNFAWRILGKKPMPVHHLPVLVERSIANFAKPNSKTLCIYTPTLQNIANIHW